MNKLLFYIVDDMRHWLYEVDWKLRQLKLPIVLFSSRWRFGATPSTYHNELKEETQCFCF